MVVRQKEEQSVRVCSYPRHALIGSRRRCDVTASEAGVVEASHVAAAVLMIHLAVVLHSIRHI